MPNDNNLPNDEIPNDKVNSNAKIGSHIKIIIFMNIIFAIIFMIVYSNWYSELFVPSNDLFGPLPQLITIFYIIIFWAVVTVISIGVYFIFKNKKSTIYYIISIIIMLFVASILYLYFSSLNESHSELNMDIDSLLKGIENNPLYYDCVKYSNLKTGWRREDCILFMEIGYNNFINDSNLCKKEVNKGTFKDVISCQREVLRLSQEKFVCSYRDPIDNYDLIYKIESLCERPFLSYLKDYTLNTGKIYGTNEHFNSTATCIDSDGGFEPGIKGHVSYYGVSTSDICKEEEIEYLGSGNFHEFLYEYVCNDGIMEVMTYNCSCENGICVGFDWNNTPELREYKTYIDSRERAETELEVIQTNKIIKECKINSEKILCDKKEYLGRFSLDVCMNKCRDYSCCIFTPLPAETAERNDTILLPSKRAINYNGTTLVDCSGGIPSTRDTINDFYYSYAVGCQ